jgi:hypothetical protein
VFGADEKQAGFGFGYFGIIVKSVTIDAWVVISILGLMAVISWFVMFSKASYVGSVDSGNDAFLELFRRQGGDPLVHRRVRDCAADRGASSPTPRSTESSAPARTKCAVARRRAASSFSAPKASK